MSAFAWREAPKAEFCVIGDPVSHSLSPKMHAAAFAALGLPYRYVAVHVPRGEVATALDHLRSIGYRGVNVTVPHKEAALEWSTCGETMAFKVRAANTIRLEDGSCANTDVPGFLDTVRDLALPNRKVLVLGAGGSARAVVAGLEQDGFELAVWNRTADHALRMLDLVGSHAPILSEPCFERAGLVVNTTSASLQGERLPVCWERLDDGAVAYDLMYANEPTPFLADAAAEGVRTMDGRAMLVAQGAHSLQYWLGIEAPRAAMMEAIA